MARLYDELFQLEQKDETKLVVSDNVTEYFFENNKQDLWDLRKDFIQLTPPFKSMFIETKHPKRIVTENEIISWDLNQFYEKWGLLLNATKINNKKITVSFFIYLQKKNEKPFRLPLIGEYSIDNKGQFIEKSFKFNILESNIKEHILAQKNEIQGSLVNPILLAISFMHCKNVEYIENDYPTAYQNKYKKRHGKPMKKYKTLKIEPMKKTLQTKGNISKNGLKKALHICRGHFKDYRENGLFGKHHEIYWWDSHVRGSEEAGEVVKDYEIIT